MPGSCLAIRSIRHGSIMQPPTTCDRHLAIARESDWFRAKPTLIRPSSDSIDDEIRTSAKSPGRPVPRSPRSGGRWRSSNSTGHAGPRRSSVSITGIRPAGPSRAGQEIQLGPCLSSLLRMELEILGEISGPRSGKPLRHSWSTLGQGSGKSGRWRTRIPGWTLPGSSCGAKSRRRLRQRIRLGSLARR